jgi:dTDP-4-amino-4,6-dideoxygalactose transaminase
MLVPASPLLSLRLGVPRTGASGWQAVFPPEALLFARGRDALHEGLRLLAAARRLERVWLPALICRPVVEAVQACGLEPRLYDVDERLVPRLDTVEGGPRDALLVVHYFGLLQPMDAIAAACRQRALALVEDAAQTLPDPGSPRPAGTWGDITMFSLRKQAPVPDGGVLVVKRPWCLPAEARRPDGVREPVGQRLAVMLAERVAFALGWNVLALKRRLDGNGYHGNGGNGHAGNGSPPGASPIARSLLRRVDWPRLIAAKQANYVGLLERVRTVPGVELPIPAPTPGSVPMGLPLVVDDARRVGERLRRAGVESVQWPDGQQTALPPRAFPGAERWLARGLALPVTAGLGRSHLDRIAAAVREALGVRRSA